MELVHQTGNDRLHDGYSGGHRRKGYHHKEQNADDSPDPSHRGKNFGQGDKHKTRSGGHALGSHENIDCRDNHHTRKQCHYGIKNLDLVDGRHQVDILFHIGAVRDHDAHSNADGVKQLSQRVHNHKEEILQCDALKTGKQINFQSFQTGSLQPRCVRVAQRQRINGNANDQNEKQGHDKFARPLNAVVHAAEDDNRRQESKNNQKDYRAYLFGDKSGKVAVCGSGGHIPGEENGKVFQYPSADGEIVR